MKKSNAALEVVLHRTPEAIEASLASFGEIRGHVGKKLLHLKGQFTGRVGRGHKHDDKKKIGMEHRALSKPHQLVMKKDPRPQVACLKELLLLMIARDNDAGRKDVVQPNKKVIRSVPTIAPAYTNEAATALNPEQLQEATKAAAPKDDEHIDRAFRAVHWQNLVGL